MRATAARVRGTSSQKTLAPADLTAHAKAVGLDLAAFAACLDGGTMTARVRRSLELGQRIWRAGIPEKSVPACAGCHGPAGSGIPVQYPRIAGQHSEYTETTLKNFRDGARRNNASMQQIAARLSDAEIKALADFTQGLRR